MNPTRFQTLAEAFGGDIARWPEPEQPAARLFARSEPETAAALLAEAASLDALLARSPNPSPSPRLRASVIASAPRPRNRAAVRRWAGASLAAASVAGVLAGLAAAPIAASHVRMQTADTAGEAARWLGEPNDATEG